ncbi:MAG: hemerythrin domain-containing protein [Halopseudomonas sp.]
MKQIMSELHQDHQHIGALLTILKNKLATLEVGSRPNFNLMLDVLDYLEDYADGHHHVREDLIFGFMRNHHQETDGLIDQVDREHRELGELTRALRASVEQVLLDGPFSIQDFTKRLRRYIDKQSQHLNLEEGRLLPLIEQLMTPADWQAFSLQAPQRQNPLLDASRHERYQQLYNALIEDLA